MMHCDRCQLDFTGQLDHCPLCGSALKGTPVPAVFPENEWARPKKLARRSLIALTLVGLALVIFAGVLGGASIVTIVAGCAAVLISYVFVRNVVVHSPSFLRMVQRYFLVLIALALLFLLATGDRSVATYVVPAISAIALLVNGVLVVLFRNTFVQGYAKYLLYELVLGLVPLALVAAGMTTWAVPSIITAIGALLLLVLMLTLTRRQLADELRKLFHA
ncbi:DUF6320 domain-containing protein [Anaerotardibacter muris]|uniref:DUF6320 domain-containing protein n=1 Tax=Anaerotardibacter muris TaxID=2941505 RepID=UPI00203AE7B2|nr:DUF6320 domain-containing protein [Anaerotardibacter muris]